MVPSFSYWYTAANGGLSAATTSAELKSKTGTVDISSVTLDVTWEYWDGDSWEELESFDNIAMTNDHGNIFAFNAAGELQPASLAGGAVIGLKVRATIEAKTSGVDANLGSLNGSYTVTVNKTLGTNSRLKLIDATSVPTPEADTANPAANPFADAASGITWELTISGGAFSETSNQYTFVVAVDGGGDTQEDTNPVGDTIYLSIAA